MNDYNEFRPEDKTKLSDILPDILSINGVVYERRAVTDRDKRLVSLLPSQHAYYYNPVKTPKDDPVGVEFPEQAHPREVVGLEYELHFDKPLLTREDINDIIRYALDLEGRPDDDTKRYLKAYIKGKPTTWASKIISVLGDALYGENNYVGPGKTGRIDGTIEEIATTVPALSDLDARARAHDIMLEVTSKSEVDDVLSGLPYVAQLGRPIFVPTVDVYTPTLHAPLAQRQNRGRFIKTQLMRGGIEQNPGPLYTFDSSETKDALIAIMDNPISSMGYLNANIIDPYIEAQVFESEVGMYGLRSGLDNQTDNIQMDTNWTEISGSNLGLSAAPGSFTSRMQQHFAVCNNLFSSTLDNGKLGGALNEALVSGADFMAMERTYANLVNGDANLGLYTRAVRVDYGMYLPCVKLFCYEGNKMLLGGQAYNHMTTDVINRSLVNNDLDPVDTVYPMSDNALPGAVQINAYLINMSQAAAMARGEMQWPADDPSSGKVAVVVLPVGIDPDALAYLTICHMEYPFAYMEHTNESVSLTPGNGVPLRTTFGTSVPVSQLTLIDGPKYTVYYLYPGNGIDSITVRATPVFLYDPALPAAVNIEPALVNYMDGIYATAGQTPEYSALIDHFLRFMDITDWRACILLCANIQRWKTCYYPYQRNQASDVNNVGIWRTSISVANSLSADSLVRTWDTLVGADRADFHQASQSTRHFCAMGWPTAFQPAAQPAFGTPHPGVPVSLRVGDSLWLTYLAVWNKMFAKKVLAGASFLETCRLRYRQVHYMIKTVSDILVQCSHNYFQSMGLLHKDLHVGFAVTDTRNMTYQGIQCCNDLLLKGVCGWIPFQIGLPYFFDVKDVVDLTTAGGVPLLRIAQYEQAPIYLFNHMANNTGKRYYGEWDPLPSFSMSKMTTKLANMIPAPRANVTRGGVVSVGAGCIRVTNTESYGPKEDQPMADNVREIFAVLSTNCLLNVGSFALATDHAMSIEANAGVFFVLPILVFAKNFLRWTASTATSDAFRDTGRGGFAFHPPVYPPEFWAGTGQRLLVAIDSQTLAYGLRRMFSLNSSGSAEFTFTIATRPPIMSRLNKYLSIGRDSDEKGDKPVNPPEVRGGVKIN